jgi:hypothetical protein
MASVVRPIFQNGERLTAQRLNEAVEFCLMSLRRALLAPLSPGVAIGLEMHDQLAVAGAVSTGVNVAAGVSIDGLGRILVLSQELGFTLADVRAQITDLATGDHVRVSLGAGRGERTIADPCAPTPGCVLERVALFFERISPISGVFPSTVVEVGVAPSVNASAESLEPALSALAYAVPLGSVTYQSDGSLTSSMLERAGVRPTLAALRNSYGDVSLRLDRIDAKAAVEFVVPAKFTAPSGGPLAQAATLAADMGMPPAGRPSPADPTVFEAAGGPGVGGVSGTSGVVAISMHYDVTSGNANGGFAAVPRSGFPLVLSAAATTAPMVAPPAQNTTQSPIGLSAGPSYPDSSDPTGARVLVPVATAGLIQAWVSVTAPTPVGTALTAAPRAVSGQWPLDVLGASGGFVLAQTALPLAPSVAPGPQLTWVWVTPPYFFARSTLETTI